MSNPTNATMRPVSVILATVIAIAFTIGRSPSLTLAAAKVTVTPSTVVAGQPVTVTGSGWASNDQILVSFTDPSGALLPLGIISADANGNFQQTIVVPPTVPPGAYQIDGNGQGGSVAVNLTIVAPPPTPAPPTAVPPTPTLEAPTPVVADVSTASPVPTATATGTATPTATATATDTPTATMTPTSTATSTSTPTNTPTLPQQVEAAGRGIGPIGLLVLVLFVLLGGYFLYRRGQSAS